MTKFCVHQEGMPRLQKKILLSNLRPLLLSDLYVLPPRNLFPWGMSPRRAHVEKTVQEQHDQELIECKKAKFLPSI